MIVGVLIILIYFAMSALMIMKKMSTFLAMTIMAILFSLLSGEPVMGEYGLFTYVIPQGALRLASTQMMVVFACWLGKIMERTGVTHTIIKKAAEFGGDKPFISAVAICVACSFLFTVLNGTGGVVLVGTVALPILLSIGMSPLAAASVYLATYGMGSLFNPANIGIYTALTGAELGDITPACVILGIISGLSMLIYLVLVFKKGGKKYAFAAPIDGGDVAEEREMVTGIRGLLACLTPVVIIALTFVIKIDLTVVFILGVVWISIFTYKGGWNKFSSMISHAIVEGWEMAAPTCSLMLAVGFLVISLGTPLVKESIMPVVDPILPKSMIALIIWVCICAPLAEYRGIFNPWGMGAGLATIFLAAGYFSAPVYFAFFWCGGRWCNVHDPSSTQCLWSANFAGTDMVTVMKHQAVYDWGIAIVGAICIIPYFVANFPL